ncbi:MAG: glutaredoxin family protein [Patescibacteria group bacterium]
MLIMYTKTGCPFCRKVEDYLNDKGIAYELKDVSTDEALIDELIELGGKRQVPYLMDTERGVSMYESDDIIQYVQDTYGENPTIIM